METDITWSFLSIIQSLTQIKIYVHRRKKTRLDSSDTTQEVKKKQS